MWRHSGYADTMSSPMNGERNFVDTKRAALSASRLDAVVVVIRVVVRAMRSSPECNLYAMAPHALQRVSRLTAFRPRIVSRHSFSSPMCWSLHELS